MSGHSKWATIKRQKGINDQKRGQTFTKLSNAITIAVKQGGGNTDPEFNASLRIAIDKAKAANMPKDGIERAMAKGSGAMGGSELSEVMYEAFGPGGAGILIEAVTDKKQRTFSEVKSTIEKNGGTLAGQGAVSYLFNKVGEIVVAKASKSLEEILTFALENEVADYSESDEVVILYTDPSSLHKIKSGAESSGILIEDIGLIYKPATTILVTPEQEEKIISLVEKLEDMDDVQKVFTNI